MIDIRALLAAATINVIVLSVPSAADPVLQKPEAVSAGPAWSGLYLGGHVGAFRSTTHVVDPFGPAVFGGNIDAPGFVAGLQLGYNWRLSQRLVAGVELDASHMDGEGTFTCLQTTVSVIGSDCKAEPRALATLTARLGTLIDQDERTLVYGKAGLAWMRSHVTMAPGNTMTMDTFTLTGDPLVQGEPVSGNISARGWVIGAGIEHALDPAWSMKLEYGYHRFGNVSVTTPDTVNVDSAGLVTQIPQGTANVSQDMHIVKLGLNYNLSGYADASRAFAPPIQPFAATTDWEFEFGTRYWYSSGRSRNDNANGQSPVVSRLTYDKLTGHSGEIFGRVDTPGNLFLKGFAGLGSITKGRHFDEDWGLPPAFEPKPSSYEATDASITGAFKYATIDLGMTVLNGSGYKVGVFGGYNYFRSTMDAFGCNQIVSPVSTICAVPVSSDIKMVSQEDNWHSFRLGISAETRLWDRFSISGDLAYVPYLFYRGLDTHWARLPITLYPSTGSGRGVQAEVILNYRLTDALSLGIGGRYWSMWTTRAEHTCLNCTVAGSVEPMAPYKNSTERYGVFVQMSYRK